MTDNFPETAVYDPYEVELEHLNALGLTEIELDFTNPQVAKFLVQQSTVRLTELLSQRVILNNLRRDIDGLKELRENLRVENAKLRERVHISWIEFPAGILCGIAGNLLTNNPKDLFAYVLLVMGIAFFLIIRLSSKDTGDKQDG